MKALLIIWLLSGESLAVPFLSIEACEHAERGLDLAQIEASACIIDPDTLGEEV